MDKIVFLRAFDEYHEAVYMYVYFKVNKSKELAEDITQEVFMKAWEKRKKYDEAKAQIKTWLLIIARNLVIDHYRKHKNVQISSITEDLLNEPSSEKSKNDEEIDIQRIREEIRCLEPIEQEALMLRYFEEFEIQEIAEIISKSEGNTRTIISRSLAKLKQQINEQNK